MNKRLFLGMFTVLLLCGAYSCKKNNDGPGSSSRDVKYEITGNYTGQLLVVITDNLSGNESFTITSLPWTKSKTYSGNVLGIGFGGNSVIAHLGLPGQTVTVKIYSGGNVVRSATVTCDEHGLANLPTFAYMF